MCKLSYLQIIRTHYEEKKAILGHDQHLEFERDQNLIRLDIPSGPPGITTSDKAWTIMALGPAVVCSAFTTFLSGLHPHIHN
jgi:hypothetical protein